MIPRRKIIFRIKEYSPSSGEYIAVVDAVLLVSGPLPLFSEVVPVTEIVALANGGDRARALITAAVSRSTAYNSPHRVEVSIWRRPSGGSESIVARAILRQPWRRSGGERTISLPTFLSVQVGDIVRVKFWHNLPDPITIIAARSSVGFVPG